MSKCHDQHLHEEVDDEYWVPPSELPHTGDGHSPREDGNGTSPSLAQQIAASFHTPRVETQQDALEYWSEEDEEDDYLYWEDDYDIFALAVSEAHMAPASANSTSLPQQQGDTSVAPDRSVNRESTKTAAKEGGGGVNKLKSEWDKWKGKINLESIHKKTENKPKHTGKDDRATVENVLDPRTRMILFRILSQGVIREIHGCISTGKEANVYHALCDANRETGTSTELAIKIYKTSILSFKDRDRYVSGEYRFRNGYSKHNPRKMVKLWAEKEMRNLKRIHAEGIPCPAPLLLRSHVLLMDFIGKDGVGAPLLKDAKLSSGKLSQAYEQLIRYMRRLYHNCHLVHADLSEYNALWMDGTVYLIDVSQSVEMDHPRALDFLRMDCRNITNFFRKNQLYTMSPKELFEFVVNPERLTDNQEEEYLARMLAMAQEREANRDKKEALTESTDEAVFMQSFIPQTLHQIENFEKEHEDIKSGNTEGIYRQALGSLPSDYEYRTEQKEEGVVGATNSSIQALQATGGVTDHSENAVFERTEQNENACRSDGVDIQETSNVSGTESVGSGDSVQFRIKDATKEERKQHKAAVKADKRAQRQNKIKKHIKKRHEKSNKKMI
eukprot:gb/GECG01005119.1/.p1 GENE.gb/GECG01005119.1/~~gb/GECG01005119.1/.p1  ORF type:complete len:613 (+),score=109.44 gb/GECG01005119.1/:1-1839(+)